MLAVAQRLPNARFIVTTLGTRGSVLLERPAKGVQVQDAKVETLQQVRGAPPLTSHYPRVPHLGLVKVQSCQESRA